MRDRIASLRVQRDFIKDLSQKAIADFSFGLARQRIDLNATEDLLNFIGQLAELERQQQDLTAEIAALEQQKQTLANPRPHKSLSLIATIEPTGAGEFELEASYIVMQASWKPLYDLSSREPNQSPVLELFSFS